MDNPAPTIKPTVVNLGQTAPPASPGRKFGGWKIFFLFGGLLILLTGLGVGTWLVQRQQSQNPQSKAAGCVFLWPADPNSACGKATQKPAEGATDVSLTPDFHWDYGGYRPGETGCVQPSGCSAYGAQVYLSEGSTYSASTIVAVCNLGGASSTTPIKDAPWSCFGLSALKPNTNYSWVPTPYFDGTVHAEQSWTYHFKTGSPAGTASCQRVLADKDLTKVKVNDTITFTGYGVSSAETEVIDKINFIIAKDGSEVSSTEEAATRDTTKDAEFSGKAWKATKSYTVTANGSYSVRIRVHWKNQDSWKE